MLEHVDASTASKNMNLPLVSDEVERQAYVNCLSPYRVLDLFDVQLAADQYRHGMHVLIGSRIGSRSERVRVYALAR